MSARVRAAALVALAAWAGSACSPALDWREVRLAGTVASALMPCRPKAATRPVPLGEQTVRLTLLACKAGGMTWALAGGEVGDATKVAAALSAWSQATLANVQGREVARAPATVRGAASPLGATQMTLTGRLPDGGAVEGRLLVFAHGTQVFQATVLGERVSAAAAEPFFESLRVGR